MKTETIVIIAGVAVVGLLYMQKSQTPAASSTSSGVSGGLSALSTFLGGLVTPSPSTPAPAVQSVVLLPQVQVSDANITVTPDTQVSDALNAPYLEGVT